MDFGLVLPSYTWEGLDADDVDKLGDIARLAEELDYTSLWTIEHFVDAPGLYGTSWLSSMTVLAYAAAVTTKVKLGTSILQAPLRNPVMLAKEIASLDMLSRHRFVLGLGTGWDQHTFESIGVDLKSRGRRTDALIDAVQALLTEQRASHHSDFFSFEDVTIQPRIPAMPPVWIAGGGKIADPLSPDRTHIAPSVLQRILRADGWIARAAGNDRMIAADLRAIREHLDRNGRDPDDLTYSHINFFHLSDASDRAGALAEQRPKIERVMGTNRPYEQLQDCYLLGTTDEIVERIQGLVDLGISTIMVSPLDYDTEQVRRFAAEVMPRIQGARVEGAHV